MHIAYEVSDASPDVMLARAVERNTSRSQRPMFDVLALRSDTGLHSLRKLVDRRSHRCLQEELLEHPNLFFPTISLSTAL